MLLRFGHPVEILFTVLQGLEGELVVDGAEKLEAQISVSAVDQLLDYFIDFVNGFVILGFGVVRVLCD